MFTSRRGGRANLASEPRDPAVQPFVPGSATPRVRRYRTWRLQSRLPVYPHELRSGIGLLSKEGGRFANFDERAFSPPTTVRNGRASILAFESWSSSQSTARRRPMSCLARRSTPIYLVSVQDLPPQLKSPTLQSFIELMLDSHVAATGSQLVDPGPLARRIAALYAAPFVALAQDAQPDPVFTFGNAMALQLWEMKFEQFTALPSNRCAEPMHRDERARFLAEVEAKGFADGYSGIRISKSGRRFRIDGVRCWNVLDRNGVRVGQAACYPRWTFL